MEHYCITVSECYVDSTPSEGNSTTLLTTTTTTTTTTLPAITTTKTTTTTTTTLIPTVCAIIGVLILVGSAVLYKHYYRRGVSVSRNTQENIEMYDIRNPIYRPMVQPDPETPSSSEIDISIL